jgi:hypothetical protein
MPRGESADEGEERHAAVRSQPRERELVQLVPQLALLEGQHAGRQSYQSSNLASAIWGTGRA